jgi:hypothetical protein
VFDELERVCQRYTVSCVFCLGDMTDKKDRFSAEMLNRLVRCWMALPVGKKVILRGNHDTTIAGSSFWEFMSLIPGLTYVTRPTVVYDDLLLLPFSANPKAEWTGLKFRDFRAIFVHATRNGTIAENGFSLSGQDLPLMPRQVKVYSGDVHIQQTVDNWVYVGAPHPVKFGDSYPCRFLLLDEVTYEVADSVKVATIGKRVVEINSLEDMQRIATNPGDQVRIKAVIPPGEIDWGAFEAEVDRWARERGVDIASIEGSYNLSPQSGQPNADLAPEDLLREFAQDEELSDELLNVGLELLREEISI